MKIDVFTFVFMVLCATLVASRHHRDQATWELKWYPFGVDLSKVSCGRNNSCEDTRTYCGALTPRFCKYRFDTMCEYCPLACKFCGPSQKPKTPQVCEDKMDDCETVAAQGDCLRFPQYMRFYCKKSCSLCGEGKKNRMLFDTKVLCPTWGYYGYCKESKELRRKCKYSCHKHKNAVMPHGLNPDYEQAFSHLPFYIYYPYATLNKSTPTIAPTEKNPLYTPAVPTLPPGASTLPPTLHFTPSGPGEEIPTPGGMPASEKPKPGDESKDPEQTTPQPEPLPTIQPTPLPTPQLEPTPQPELTLQPEPIPQPEPAPQPEPVPQPEPIPQPEPAPQPEPTPQTILQPHHRRHHGGHFMKKRMRQGE